MIDRPRLRALLFGLAAVLAAPAGAQKILYKLIDRQGRVIYTDSVPKNFDGTVTPLEPVTESNVVPSAKPPEDAARAKAPPGINETRRQAREALDEKLRAAQAKAEAARKAKAEGADPLRRGVADHPAPLRAAAVGAAAADAQLLPSRRPRTASPSSIARRQVPNDAYYARQKKLDDDLAAAEEELTARRAGLPPRHGLGFADRGEVPARTDGEARRAGRRFPVPQRRREGDHGAVVRAEPRRRKEDRGADAAGLAREAVAQAQC